MVLSFYIEWNRILFLSQGDFQNSFWKFIVICLYSILIKCSHKRHYSIWQKYVIIKISVMHFMEELHHARTPSTFCSFIMIHLWCIIFISMTYLFHYNLNVIYGIAYSKFGNWKICNIILLLYMYNSPNSKVQTDSMLLLKVRKDTHSYIICYHFITDAYVNFTLLSNTIS